MDFITYSDLSNDIVNNIARIPKDIDIIVGVPRSGMLVANMIGLYLNKPIADLDSFCDRRIYSSGRTKSKCGWIKDFKDIKKVLLCEDSVASGFSIQNAIMKIKAIYSKEIISLAAYTVPENKSMMDIYFRIVEAPRFFEWNYLHHIELRHTCFDIDGVLCVDPTKKENDNGENYKHFILNATPKLIPTRKVGYLVTSRLEKYRKETEQWLKNNNIDYGQLIMYQGSFKQRIKNNDHAEFKSKVYNELKEAVLFVESESWQAEKIRNITGKHVFCVSDNNNYPPSFLYSVKKRIRASIPDTFLGIPISKKARKRMKNNK